MTAWVAGLKIGWKGRGSMSYSKDGTTLQVVSTEGAHVPGGPSPPGKEQGAAARSLERMEKLVRVLHMLIETKFTGFVKLNFSQGNLGRVEKFEEILRK